MRTLAVVLAAFLCSYATTALADAEQTAKRAGKFVEKTAKRAGKFVERTATKAGKIAERAASKADKAIKKLTED